MAVVIRLFAVKTIFTDIKMINIKYFYDNHIKFLLYPVIGVWISTSIKIEQRKKKKNYIDGKHVFQLFPHWNKASN